MRRFYKFKSAQEGSVSVEMSFLVTLMVLLTAGVMECGFAFWQWNSAQQAARHGARLAATSDPIANDILNMTGLGNGDEAGDTFPEYERHCSGRTASCNQGSYNEIALNAIVYGRDNDGKCEKTVSERRGICDVVSSIQPENIDITYANSGRGRAGSPADPAPLITVTIKDLEFDFVLLGSFFPDSFRAIPPVSVSVMSEDLRSNYGY